MDAVQKTIYPFCSFLAILPDLNVITNLFIKRADYAIKESLIVVSFYENEEPSIRQSIPPIDSEQIDRQCLYHFLRIF